MRLSLLFITFVLSAVVGETLDEEFETTPETSVLHNVPATAPLWGTGVDVIDAYMVHPPQLAGLYAKLCLRGSVQALRDILFSHVMTDDAVVSPIDTVMFDEGMREYAWRLAVRDWWRDQARSYGVYEYAQRSPSTVRYVLAGTIGVIMMLFICVVQALAGCSARWCMRFMFWATGDDAHLDHMEKSARALRAKTAAATAAAASAAESTASGGKLKAH